MRWMKTGSVRFCAVSNRRAPCRCRVLAFLPLAPFVLLMVAGIGYTGMQSLGLLVSTRSSVAYEPGYAAILGSAWFYRSLFYSLYIASVSTGLAVILGTLLALALRRLPDRLFTAALVYKVPLILPHVVIGLIVLLAFGGRGLIARAVDAISFWAALGLTHRVFDLLSPPGSGALIAAYVFKSAPFVTLLVYAVLRRFDTRQTETARMLGAGAFLRFRCLLFPVLWPPAATAGVIVFLFSFGAFDLPFLLGGSRPAMLAIDVFNRYWYRDLSARPAAMASLIVMLAISLAFVIVYFLLVRRQRRGVRHV